MDSPFETRSLPGRTVARLAVGIGVLAALLLAPFALARFEWRDVVQEVTIEPDGSVVVDDTRTLWTNEDFGEAFICIPLAPGESLTLLGGSGAVDAGPPATARSQPCIDQPNGTEVVVAHDDGVRVRERRVRFRYRLEGIVQVHADVVQFYWNLLRSVHPPIVGYDLVVTAPGPMAAPYDAYVHRYANPEAPRVVLSEDRRRLGVAFDRVPENTPLEVRWLMDPSVFSVRGSGERLEDFLRDEAEIAGVRESRSRRSAVIRRVFGSPWWGLLPLAGILWLVRGVWRDFRRVGREPDLPQMQYPFEPPNDLPPAAVVALRMQNFQTSGMSDAFRATIMDLARRGFGEFAGTEKKFEMVLHPDADTSQLEPFELDVLEFLADAAASGLGVGGSALEFLRAAFAGEIDELPKDDPNHLAFDEFKRHATAKLSTFMKTWSRDVRDWVEARYGGPLVSEASRAATQRWIGRAFAVTAGSGLLAWLVFTGAAQVLFLAGSGAAVVALVVAARALPSWRPEVARDVYGWNGFQRTLTDYTRMKDAPLDFYKLWDRYFVYAAALGVATKFLRALERAAPEAGVEPSTLTRSATWMGSSVASTGDLGSFSSAVTSLSSALASASASASSGGSSAGGGGGGGGGGSSGGR